MPVKGWIQHLPDGFDIRVFRRTKKGALTEFAIVLVYDDECITRYDTAHGAAHRDVLGKKSGLIKKVYCGSVTNEEAFDYAIHDLKANFRTHLAFYLAR